MDLENPKTLNEKISVYKLLYREKPLWRFADKYAVRDHIKERLGERYLIPLIGVYEHVDDIDFDALPDRFIVKPNHGSGWFMACQDRNVFDREKCKKLCASWLKINFYDVNREWAYKQIPPKIIIEELLIESPDRTSKDYKLYCFNGKPAYINVIADRFGEKTLQDFDVNWNKVPFKAITPGPKQDEERPENLQELLDIATNLSGDFPFVRVDLYARPKVYFGEFTFYPGAGLTPFGDARKDLLYGSCLDMRPIYESKQVYT